MLRCKNMQKSTTVKSVVQDKADLTEARFCVVKAILDNDPILRKRVFAYLKVYHIEHKCTTMDMLFEFAYSLGIHCTTLFINSDTFQILCALAIISVACLIVYAYSLYIKIQRIKK